MKKDGQLHFRASSSDRDVIEKATKIHSEISGANETISSTIIQAASEFATHAPNKVLIDDHRDEAMEFIDRLECVYIPAVRSVIESIKRLGVQQVSNELLSETMRGNYTLLEQQVNIIANGNVMSISSSAGRYQEQIAWQNLLQEVCNGISMIIENAFDDRRKEDPVSPIGDRKIQDVNFFEHLSFDETGKPYLSETTKTEILESHKVYIISKKAAAVYKAHQKAAQAMQEFLSSLKGTTMAKALNIGNPWNTISGLFELSRIDERLLIEPRKVNYNYLLNDSEEEAE